MLLLRAIAIIGEGALSVFAATRDVWMGLNKGPILSWRHSSRGLALLGRPLGVQVFWGGRALFREGVSYIQIPLSSRVSSSWVWGSQTGRRRCSHGALRGLPWCTTDACNFPLPPRYCILETKLVTFLCPSSSNSIVALCALPLPQIAAGLLESCWQIMQIGESPAPAHLDCAWPPASCARQQGAAGGHSRTGLS